MSADSSDLDVFPDVSTLARVIVCCFNACQVMSLPNVIVLAKRRGKFFCDGAYSQFKKSFFEAALYLMI
jgi:hypothetical protein